MDLPDKHRTERGGTGLKIMVNPREREGCHVYPDTPSLAPLRSQLAVQPEATEQARVLILGTFHIAEASFGYGSDVKTVL